MTAKKSIQERMKKAIENDKEIFLMNGNNEVSNNSSSTRKGKIEVKCIDLAKDWSIPVAVNNDFSGARQPVDPREANNINKVWHNFVCARQTRIWWPS